MRPLVLISLFAGLVVIAGYSPGIAAQSVQQGFVTGRPSDIDPKKDYYRAGMDAGYAKDYLRAAREMRYSFYQNRDGYRLFWYLSWLSRAGYHDAVIAEASAATDDERWHKAYQSGSVKFWAQALLDAGKRDEAVAVLVREYELHRDPQLALMLVSHFWNSEKAGAVFLNHPRHAELVSDVITRFAGTRSDAHAGLAKSLFEHLVAAASVAAMRSVSDAAYVKRFNAYAEALRRVGTVWGADPKAINAADWRVLEKAFSYFAANPPAVRKPYEFLWLNCYVPRVNATILEKGKPAPLAVELPREFIERRILDLQSQFDVMAVFYYYLTNGAVLMRSRFELLDATVTRTDSKSPLQSIVTESVRPYPAKLLYNGYRNWDGLMWWFPHYGSSAYLGGAKKIAFVPDILSGTDSRMFAKMSTGASWRVLVHEAFHSFGTLCKVAAGHDFTVENRAKWPDWYRSGVAANAGATSELLWYEGIISRRNNADAFAPVRRRSRDWMPAADVFERAERLGSTLSASRVAAVEVHMAAADAAGQKKNAAEDIAQLRKAVQLASEMPEPLFQLAYRTQWRAKDKAGAIALYEEYLNRFGGGEHTDTALIYLGGWYQTQDPARGLSLLEKYGGNPLNDGTWSELQLRRVRLLKQLGRADEARAALQLLLNDVRNTKVQESRELEASLR